MNELFQENWSCLQCGQCKWFKVDADRTESICKRLDHKRIKFAKPWFKSYDCGQFFGTVCKDFEPKESCVWLYNHWNGYDDYYTGDEIKGTISLCLDDDFSVRYKVLKSDFVNGTFLDSNGDLKWIEKEYYKQSRKSPTGYMLVHEENKCLEQKKS